MSSTQITAVLVGVGVLLTLRTVLRKVVHSSLPQVLPGEENTILLASPRANTSTPTTAEDLDNVTEYDYIIVGTGTAGCVLANRLSEDHDTSVLAIEAGHSDLKQLMSRVPAALNKLFKTAVDWAFMTAPQKHCDNRELYWPRGKMIGGSSSINAMLYTRGSPDDYNEWERMGNKGWAYKDLVTYARKAEKFSQPKDPAIQLPAEDLAQHGKDGPWKIGYTWRAKVGSVMPDACDDIGISKVADINTDKGILGAAATQSFIDNQGQRSSAAVAYLTADVVRRPNLKIASGQTVTKIIFDTRSQPPRAIGIEMAASKTAMTRYLVKARKEVILCAGSIGTPQLLKVSGVGPAKELSKHNIPIVKELPGVGENLVDHMGYNGIVFKTDKDVSIHYLFNPIKTIPHFIEWFRFGTGPMTSLACESVAFVRSADRTDLPSSLKDIDHSSGKKGADLELIAFSLCVVDYGKFIAPLTSGYCMISPVCLRPQSRGSIKLLSSSVFDAPTVDPNALADDYDLEVLLYGVKLALKVAKAEAYKPYFKGWYNGPHHPIDWDAATDEQIKAHIRKTCDTLYHPMGTTKMGHDADAVVDDQLRVHGVDGLRIVDASIFPTALACHPCAPVIMIAEKAADLIKNSGK